MIDKAKVLEDLIARLEKTDVEEPEETTESECKCSCHECSECDC